VNIDDKLRFVYLEYLQRYGKPSGYFTYKPDCNPQGLPKEILVLYWQNKKEKPLTHFATLGMSSLQMQDGEVAELCYSVRSVLSGDDILEFSRFLANFTMYPFMHDFSVSWWNIIVDIDSIPLYPDSNALLIHPEPNNQGPSNIHMGEDVIKLFNIVPLTSEESNMVQDKGVVQLLDYLELNEIDVLAIR
jgi:hypothetical protein